MHEAGGRALRHWPTDVLTYKPPGKLVKRTMYLHGVGDQLYVGEMKGADLDIYEVKGKGPHLTRVMICSCQVGDADRTEPCGERVIMRHLPIGHVPPLAVSQNPVVREAALERLAAGGK
jgi:hypothetical protein